MRFRIQTDGKKFRVQWWGKPSCLCIARWVMITRYDEGDTDFYASIIPLKFINRDEAEAWIRENYGTQAEIVREWRTV